MKGAESCRPAPVAVLARAPHTSLRHRLQSNLALALPTPQVLKLLRRRERWLVAAAIRFLRTALSLKVRERGRREAVQLARLLARGDEQQAAWQSHSS